MLAGLPVVASKGANAPGVPPDDRGNPGAALQNGGMNLRRRQPAGADLRGVFSSNRALRAVLLTDLLVLVAELAAAVVLPWWITGQGGAHAMAVFSITLALAAFVVAPAVSPWGDKLCKSRQVTWGLAGLGAVAALQAVLSGAGVFNVALLAGLAALQVLAASFVHPARDAVLAELVPAAALAAAIRLRKTTQAVAGILGPLLAGAALGLAGVTVALWGCSALLAAAMLVAMRLPRTPVAAAPRSPGAWARDLRAGLAAKWRVPMERGWTAVNFVVWIFQGPAVGLLIPIKVQSLGLQGQWLGASLGALSVGSLLGSVLGSQWLVGCFGRYRVRVGLGVAEGLMLALVGWAGSPLVMLAGLLAAGFCNAAMSLVGATHRALAIPREYRVRMFAAGAMATQVAGALGPALVAWRCCTTAWRPSTRPGAC